MQSNSIPDLLLQRLGYAERIGDELVEGAEIHIGWRPPLALPANEFQGRTTTAHRLGDGRVVADVVPGQPGDGPIFLREAAAEHVFESMTHVQVKHVVLVDFSKDSVDKHDSFHNPFASLNHRVDKQQSPDQSQSQLRVVPIDFGFGLLIVF